MLRGFESHTFCQITKELCMFYYQLDYRMCCQSHEVIGNEKDALDSFVEASRTR